MLETVLNYLHNWFLIPGAARAGTFIIVSGKLKADFLADGQYYRIEGSIHNNGLHRYPYDEEINMLDETFSGAIFPMAVPRSVIALSEKIAEWCKANPATDKISESFDGYSYTKAAAGASGTENGWQAVFRGELRAWKKVGGL